MTTVLPAPPQVTTSDHEAYIRAETLAVALSDDAPEHGVHSETADVDGHEVTLSVVRV